MPRLRLARLLDGVPDMMSTRLAAFRCIRCGALGEATIVNIPIGCREPVDIGCGYVDMNMCPEAQRLAQAPAKETK